MEIFLQWIGGATFDCKGETNHMPYFSTRLHSCSIPAKFTSVIIAADRYLQPANLGETA